MVDLGAFGSYCVWVVEGETLMTELSQATQAVLDAFRTSHTGQGCLAAALRAAANQVVEEVSPVEAILAIAAELESCNGRLPSPSVALSMRAANSIDPLTNENS